MNLAFEWPLLLAASLVLLAAAGVLTRGRVYRGVPGVLRLVALLVLAAAAAGPHLALTRPGLLVLTDVSDSAGAPPKELSGVVAATRLEFAGRAGEAGTDRAALDTSASDLRGALQVARAYHPARILLASDGNATTGDPLDAVPDVPVDVLQVPSRDNARVADLVVPASVTPGGTVRATAVIETTRATRARLLPSVAGKPLPAITLNLKEGRNTAAIDFVAGDPGEFALDVRLEVDYGQPTSDDSKVAYTRASGGSPVLVIGDPAAARLLRSQGFAVREGSSEDVREPFTPAAAVIREAATDFTPAQLTLLANYVRDGGGLFLTGGPRSFGLGSWARTPVEELLPVSTDLRTRVDVPLVALVMVLDRSLSMSGGGFGNTGSQKLSLAVEGAGNVIELAHERDLLGLITFSDTAKWVFKPMRASESNKLQMLRAAQAIASEGGTVLEPAYREAIRALEDVPAAIKHIILLTDGQLADDQTPFANGKAPDFSGIAKAARKEGITTSSIGIGGDADMPRLKAIAQAGGGRFYSALDVDTLPRIFTTEALTATRSLVRSERFTPTLVRHALASGVRGTPPPLTSYVATTLRSSAEPIVVGLDREPVLAVARKGLGRTAALTADLNRADPFTSWQELPALIGTVTRWLQSPPAPYALRVSEDGRTAIVDAVARNQYVNGERLELRAGAQTLTMVQTAPGRYEAALPDGASGSAVLTRGGEVLARAHLQPQLRELDTSGGAETLRRIAQASGGRVITSLEGYAGASSEERVPLAPLVAIAGAVILLLELAWRRFRL